MKTKGRKKASEYRRPEGEVRQSQVLTTYGAGSMIDLVEDSILVGGLDFWRYEGYPGGIKACEIDEPRLAEALHEKLAKDLDLAVGAPFRKPPDGDDKEPSPLRGIQAQRFPRWFVCQNAGCRALLEVGGLEEKKGRLVHTCDRSTESPVVPVRFVAACKNGHLQDFPWISFVHEIQGKERCSLPRLRLVEGATGDFSQILVTCVCGASQKLSAALAPGILLKCFGHRPWLGRDAEEPCDETLRLLVRTATNAYFSQVVSALTIPEPERELDKVVEESWHLLEGADSIETVRHFRKIRRLAEVLERFEDQDVLDAVIARRDGREAPRLPLRTAEFLQLVAQPEERPGETSSSPAAIPRRRVCRLAWRGWCWRRSCARCRCRWGSPASSR